MPPLRERVGYLKLTLINVPGFVMVWNFIGSKVTMLYNNIMEKFCPGNYK